jgi:hypothetical protein
MIPGVVVHARESWQDPAWPVVGPPANQAAIDTAVVHYTASPKIPGDLFAFHRSMQFSYAKPRTQGGRGYSLGYRWSVVSGGPRDGEVFQIRGFDLKAAANAGHNDHTEPILVLVDGDDAATPLAVRSVQAIIAESQRRSGRTFVIVGHGQLSGAATSCPGVGLRAQVAAGVFTPRAQPPTPPPTIPPTNGDHLMLYIAKPVYAGANANTPWLAVFESGQIRRALNSDVKYASANGVAIIEQDSREQHEYAINKFGI